MDRRHYLTVASSAEYRCSLSRSRKCTHLFVSSIHYISNSVTSHRVKLSAWINNSDVMNVNYLVVSRWPICYNVSCPEGLHHYPPPLLLFFFCCCCKALKKILISFFSCIRKSLLLHFVS